LEGNLADREEPLVTGNMRAARDENRIALEGLFLKLWAGLWIRIEES
jgi:hypothetical protein